jgi:putative ABC transport system permease protein
LAFVGVAIGVMVLIVAMAIMQGMIKEFEDKLFVMNYPITIESQFWSRVDSKTLKDLRKAFPEMAFSPYLRAQGVAKSGNIMEGVIVFGVEAESESKVNRIFDEFYPKDGLKRFEVMVGKSLKESLFIDNERLMVIFTSVEPVGIASTPLMKRFKINNTFDSGLQAYDKAYIYSNLDDLRRILRIDEGRYDGIHVYAKDPMAAKIKIEKMLPKNMSVTGWWEQNISFFAAINLEKKALFIVLMLIILVASLNIVTSLLMTVMNRRKEVALLLSLGASKKEIKKIFFTIGSVIGISGVIVGMALGLGTLWVIDTFELISLPAEVYGTSKLPLDLSTLDFISIIIGAIVVVLGSAYYPAKKASEVDILKVLRSE